MTQRHLLYITNIKSMSTLCTFQSATQLKDSKNTHLAKYMQANTVVSLLQPVPFKPKAAGEN